MAQDKLLAEWFWIDRWVGSSAFSLPIAARGLYREMLTQAWRRGARLPNDLDQVRRMTGVTMREWKQLWPKVRRFWDVKRTEHGSFLINKTQLEVYADAKARADRASNRGIAGAQARAQALRKQRLSTAQDVLEHEPPITDHRHQEEEPPVVPLKGGRVTRADRKQATHVVHNRMGRCPHEPQCASSNACIEVTALEIHEKAAVAS